MFDAAGAATDISLQTNDCCIYGEDAPSYPTVTRWAVEFRRGRKSFQYEPRSGCPPKAVCRENCRAIANTVLQNRRVNVQLTADGVDISTG